MLIKKKIRRLFSHKEPDFWIPEFDRTKSIFIHIPKAAGTSLSHAIYKKDTWHYLISVYKDYNQSKFNKYFKFAFTRNPFDRLLSTYLYSFIQEKRLPSTSVAFVTEYKTFEDFIINWVNKNNIYNHYFFFSQTKYISDDKSMFLVDFVGRFETLLEDYEFLKHKLLINIDLPKKNSTNHSHYRDHYSKKMRRIVENVYDKDLNFLSYKF